MIEITTKIKKFLIKDTDIINGKRRLLKNINNLNFLKFNYGGKQVALFGGLLKTASVKEI